MFVDHILAIGGLSSASTLLRTCIYVRPGVARVAAVVIQGHISFDANISLFTPESDLVTRRGWIWHFHIDLVFTIPLSLATPGPSWRLHPSQYYKLASPSPASHSALWLLAQINLMMSLKIEETLCWSFAVLTSISLWDLDIEHSFTELQKLRSLHIEY